MSGFALGSARQAIDATRAWGGDPAAAVSALATAIAILEGIGFPSSLEKLRVTKPQRLLPVRNVRLLRNRYTAFDLAYELGQEAELLAAIAAAA